MSFHNCLRTISNDVLENTAYESSSNCQSWRPPNEKQLLRSYTYTRIIAYYNYKW